MSTVVPKSALVVDHHPLWLDALERTLADVEIALGGGVSAYLVKDARPDDLRVAVRQSYARSLYLPVPRGHGGEHARAFRPGETAGLTQRELAVLRFTAEGLTNGEIARKLLATDQTVKYHLSNIYRKLGVHNRTGATRWAQLHGLLPPNGAPSR
jgi:DNA-binding NarL/FixJ family response regulator